TARQTRRQPCGKLSGIPGPESSAGRTGAAATAGAFPAAGVPARAGGTGGVERSGDEAGAVVEHADRDVAGGSAAGAGQSANAGTGHARQPGAGAIQVLAGEIPGGDVPRI